MLFARGRHQKPEIPTTSQVLLWTVALQAHRFQPVFRTMMALAGQSGECRLCQFLVEHRLRPKPQYTTCLFNNTWMAAAQQRYVPRPASCSGAGFTAP
jgi:hypothetical protein